MIDATKLADVLARVLPPSRPAHLWLQVDDAAEWARLREWACATVEIKPVGGYKAMGEAFEMDVEGVTLHVSGPWHVPTLAEFFELRAQQDAEER